MQSTDKNTDYNQLGTVYEQSLDRYVRKHGGIFYTPQFITEYICQNTLGELCAEKKNELNFNVLNLHKLEIYKAWLLTLKILDPACGSGAFLNQTLDYLINEHKQIDSLINELTGETIKYFDTDKQILENNIYGVDINEESVEIAKLSLWLRTAKSGRTLSDLSGNIKCGNSLIDDPQVAGDKAFDWNVEFKEIMDNGGFDVVVGNPPYVRGRTFDEKTRNFFKRYETGSLDTAILFIKKAKSLINSKGRMGYIVPKSLLFASNWDTIRKFIAPFLTTVIDCSKVWGEVLLEQVIFIANSYKTDYYTTGSVDGSKISDAYRINKRDIDFFDFLPANLSQKQIDIGYKIKSKSVSLNEIADNIAGVPYQKYITEAGEYSMLGGSEFNRFGIHSIKGKIGKEWAKTSNAFIQPNSVLVQNILTYISKPVESIRITACIPDGDIKTFALANTVNQIIVNEQNTHKYNNKYLWCILNAKITNWYAFHFIFAHAKMTMHFYKPISQKIPVPLISESLLCSFSSKCDTMLSLNKELQIEKNNILHTLKEEKGMEKISNKINELQSQINQTDKEIDRMVYEVYELTPEEIEIVENA